MERKRRLQGSGRWFCCLKSVKGGILFYFFVVHFRGQLPSGIFPVAITLTVFVAAKCFPRDRLLFKTDVS